MRRALFALSIASGAFGAWTACSSFASENLSEPTADTSPPDADVDSNDGSIPEAASDAGKTCDPAGEWKKEPIPRIVDGGAVTSIEVMGTLSKDELSLYFAAATTSYFRVYRSERTSLGAPFGNANVLDLGSPVDKHDQHPSISDDGNEIIFSSDRAQQAIYRLYVARRDTPNVPFSPASPAVNPLAASDYIERTPSRGPNGELWFSTTRFNAIEQIVTAQRLPAGTFDTPVPHESLNAINVRQLAPALSRDGLTIYFSRLRQGTTNEYDVWFARRPNANVAFNLPEKIPSLSTYPQTLVSWVSADGCRLLISYVVFGAGQLYWATQ